MIVYDITNEISFEEIENYYIPTIEQKCKENIPIMIVGNKTDIDDMRKISVTQGKELASRHDYIYNETSCIDNSNLADIFRIIIEISYRKIKSRLQNNNNHMVQLNQNNQFGGRICFRCC